MKESVSSKHQLVHFKAFTASNLRKMIFVSNVPYIKGWTGNKMKMWSNDSLHFHIHHVHFLHEVNLIFTHFHHSSAFRNFLCVRKRCLFYVFVHFIWHLLFLQSITLDQETGLNVISSQVQIKLWNCTVTGLQFAAIGKVVTNGEMQQQCVFVSGHAALSWRHNSLPSRWKSHIAGSMNAQWMYGLTQRERVGERSHYDAISAGLPQCWDMSQQWARVHSLQDRFILIYMMFKNKSQVQISVIPVAFWRFSSIKTINKAKKKQ